ncbi:MAG TPA: 2-C-methyl-D-erythritol 4-phosphate cytidylyltransferase [Actinomycetota bacterium]|nr:2-C-methyl-D-erythritol 4-phosphate cytidylyltransferase [Actinomycetota bacterium]
MRVVAVVLAAGAGERLGLDLPKAFAPVGGRTMLELAAAAAAGAAERLVVAVPPGEEGRARDLLARVGRPAEVIAGGETRQASVRAALALAPPDAEAVLCHDAARPFASPGLFRAVLEALSGADGAVPVVPIPDTVKVVEGGWVVETLPRERLGAAQTPQAFRAGPLREAHARALAAGRAFTDDAAVLEWAGFRVRAVPGEPGNFKVTTVEDLRRAEAVAAGAGRG